jgi:uncharacterized protein (DUF2236 family)
MSREGVSVSAVAWQVNGERVTVLGWGRAILMQLAHPLVAAGVAHSAFAGSPLAPARRLHGTVTAMLDLTFGDAAAGGRAAQRIRAIHDRVNGRLASAVGRFPAGTPYSAHDVDLLLWVHATLLDSMLVLYERVVAPLAEAEREAYLREAALGMTRIGLPAERAPQTMAALRSTIEDAHRDGRLAVAPSSRALADAVLAPPFGWAILPVVRLQRLLTIGLLPPSFRELYGFHWTPARERRFETLVSALRRVRRASPAIVARFAAARRPPPAA